MGLLTIQYLVYNYESRGS